MDGDEFFGQSLRAFDLDGLKVTLLSYPEPQKQPVHEHPELHAFFVTSAGRYDSSSIGTLYQPPQSLLWRPAGAKHSSEVGPSGVHGLNLAFQSEWLSKWQIGPSDMDRYWVAASREHSLICWRLVSLALSKSPDAAQMQALAAELFGCSFSSEAPNDNRLVARAMALIESRCCTSLSLKEVAEALDVHPVYLARVVRSATGKTVTSQIMDRKVCRAARLIASNGLSIGEAAAEVEFVDQPYLNRCFKRYGIAPGAIKHLAKLHARLQ